MLINPRGETALGRDEIRLLLAEFLGGPARDSRHSTRVIRVSFVTDEVAVVDGEASVDGATSSSASVRIAHRFTDVLVRTGDAWLIAHVRAYPPDGGLDPASPRVRPVAPPDRADRD